MDMHSFNPGQNSGRRQDGPTWQMSKLRLREVDAICLRSRPARPPLPVISPNRHAASGIVRGLPDGRPAPGGHLRGL